MRAMVLSVQGIRLLRVLTEVFWVIWRVLGGSEVGSSQTHPISCGRKMQGGHLLTNFGVVERVPFRG